MLMHPSRLAAGLSLCALLGAAAAAEETPGADPAAITAQQRALERAFSNGAASVSAFRLHDLGITGQDVRVNVVDTGVRATHREFGARVLTGLSRDVTIATPPAGTGITDGYGHGTFVASIIAGAADGWGLSGVAPMASIVSSQAMSAANGWAATDATLLAAVRNGANGGAFIHNMSLAGPGPVGEAALREAVARGTLTVVAAGNRGADHPDWPARYAKEAWAGNAIIAVGAVDASSRIAGFSNRAGDTANWYLVALGVNVTGAGATSDSALVAGSGTSMAAPIVSGVAALIKSRWPTLRASDVAEILFATAVDLGAKGVDPVYGRGLVNAERAMQPVGTTWTQAVDGRRVQSPGTLLATSNAWGRPISRLATSGALDSVVFDQYRRDFTQGLANAVVTPRPVGFEGLAPFTDRQIRFAEKVLDPLGSRMLLTHEVRLDLRRPDGVEVQSLANHDQRFRAPNAMLGAAWVQKFNNGAQFGVGVGGTNAFFGLQGMDTVSTQIHAQGLLTPMLAMVPLAQSAGVAVPLDAAWDLKLGVAGSQGSNAVAEQLGITGGTPLRQTLALAELNRAFDGGRTVLGLQYAHLTERDSLAGGQGFGMLSLSGVDAATEAFTLQGATRLTDHLVAGAQFTSAMLPATTNNAASLVTGSTGMRLTGWGVGLTRTDAFREGDRLAFTVSEPLAVRAGSLLIDVPAALDASGNLQYRREAVAVGGDARERLYELAWALPLAHGRAGITVSTMLRQHALGQADAPNELLAIVRYSQAF